ncbi:MAG: MOSC domain-containing protein [Sulfurovaceae bacterium]|nr:MOSC domain-containing protein [Sulfurovaceae bacterium]
MSCSLINREIFVGKILKLFISKKLESEDITSKRVSKQEIIVDERGIWEDKFYDKELNRSILITSIDSYRLAEKQKISVEYGSLGENILIDYNPYSLHVGTQIRIGEVVLEITQNCTLCKSLTKIDKKLPKLLKNDRGVFAKVIKSGFIHKDDEIFVMYVKYNQN